jgi:dienelactone hydrolase
MMLRWLGLLSYLILCVARAQAPASLPWARDLFEEVHEVEVSVQDLYGRREQGRIPVTIYRPQGEGPFPLVILNHGRASVPEKRANPARFRFEQQARYFVGKGLAVMVPTRVGYGQAMQSDFDPEYSGGCAHPRIEPMSLAASDQVLAVLAHARSLPFIDATRWWVVGQSVGGLTSVATVWRQPPGLQGGINFSGGTGGDPDGRPGRPCGSGQIAQLWRDKAANARVPMIWFYWENDLFWGPENPRMWHRAWTEGGAQAQLRMFGPIGKDGHSGFNLDMDRWTPVLDDYFARWGITQAALPPMPSPTSFAAIDDLQQVPVSAAQQKGLYARFLASPSPRAFAIGPQGAAGYAAGDWAVGRALGYCQSRLGVRCQLYAVDNQVVWRN